MGIIRIIIYFVVFLAVPFGTFYGYSSFVQARTWCHVPNYDSFYYGIFEFSPYVVAALAICLLYWASYKSLKYNRNAIITSITLLICYFSSISIFAMIYYSYGIYRPPASGDDIQIARSWFDYMSFSFDKALPFMEPSGLKACDNALNAIRMQTAFAYVFGITIVGLMAESVVARIRT